MRAEWEGPGFPSSEFGPSLDAVCERLGVNQEHNRPSPRDEVLARGLAALGWHVDSMPRNVVGCEQGVDCGYCGYGCRLGAKQSTVKTWLADAPARARGSSSARRRGACSSRAAPRRASRPGRSQVRCARGRGGLRRDPDARAAAPLRAREPEHRAHLRLHPATVVLGVFDEEVRPWEGTMQALYSDQHRYLDGGYGVKYETAAPSGAPDGCAPWGGRASTPG